MLINDQKKSGRDLLNAGALGTRTFFNISGRKIGADSLSQTLSDNSVSQIIPLAIVLDGGDCDAGSEVEILL